LFFVPALVLLIGFGAQRVGDAVAPHSRLVGVLLVALLFVDPAAPLLRFREKTQRVALRPALEYVMQERTDDERVYVAYGAKPLLDYYVPQIGLTADDLLIQSGSVFEPPSVAKLAALLADLERVRHEPTWVVLAYVPGEEQKAVLRELRWTGRLSRGPEFRRVEVYHYVPS